jgi:hypothetical protein
VSADNDNPMQPPPWLNAPPVEPYPFEETYDLRHGPDLHPALLGLLPYIGVWRGQGTGGYPTMGEDFRFAQEITISHDGRPFLFYNSRSWLLDEESKPVRPSGREVGWWRPGGDKNGDEVEALMMSPTGIMELYFGTLDGLKLEMATEYVMRTPTAKEVNGARRLYGIIEGALLYAHEMAAVGQPLTPHLSARLVRVGG